MGQPLNGHPTALSEGSSHDTVALTRRPWASSAWGTHVPLAGRHASGTTALELAMMVKPAVDDVLHSSWPSAASRLVETATPGCFCMESSEVMMRSISELGLEISTEPERRRLAHAGARRTVTLPVMS